MLLRILPWWREWTYCNGLAVSNSTWWNIYDSWQRNYDNRLFKLLACTEPDTIINYLTLIIDIVIIQPSSESEKLLVEDIINNFPFILAKLVKDKDMLLYILDNILYFGEASVMPRMVNMIPTLTIIINHVYSELELNIIKNYVTNIEQQYQFSTNEERKVWENVVQHVSKIYKKIQIRKSEIESQKKYLQSFKLTK